MRLTITRENLTKLLGTCIGAAKPRSPSPVLQCVLLETTKDGLRGAATDLIQNVVTSAPATVSQAGAFAVNARDFAERAKLFPAGPIDLAHAKNKLTMTAGKRKHVLSTLPAEEFPSIAEPKGEPIAIPAVALKRILGRTKFAMAHDETRPHLHGVNMTRGAGKLSACATDGHRLAMGVEIVEGLTEAPPFIIPAPAVEAIFGLLDDGEVKLFASGPMLWFTLGATTLATKVPEATFPNVDSFMANEPRTTFTAPASAIVAALRSVERASKDVEKDPRRYVGLDLSPGTIRIHAEGKGEAEDEVESSYEGKAYGIGMCSTYFCEAIEAAGTETVRISVSPGDDLDPVWVRPADGESGLVLCMPSRV